MDGHGQKKKTSSRGMTLVEVVIAVALVAIIAAVFLGMFLSSAAIMKKSGEISRQNNGIAAAIDGDLPDGMTVEDQGRGQMAFTFSSPAGEAEVKVDGEYRAARQRESSDSVEIHYFVPDGE